MIELNHMLNIVYSMREMAKWPFLLAPSIVGGVHAGRTASQLTLGVGGMWAHQLNDVNYVEFSSEN